MTTILMVEDEMNLAMMLEDFLDEAGFHVLKAGHLPRALELVARVSADDRTRIDVAILDINLAGVKVFPLADVLRELGIPFMFTSGYGAEGLPAEYQDCAVLQKPYNANIIIRTVQALTHAPEGADLR